MDMSRIESGSIKIEEVQVHLPELLQDIRTIVQPDIEAKQMNFLIDTNEITNEDVLCDKLHLSQILLNLLSNAVKYTPPGGDIADCVVQKPFARSEFACYEFIVTMQFWICEEAEKSDAPDLIDTLKTELDLREKKILLAEDNELNREIANIPIISLTVNDFDSDRKKALRTGMNGYIAKPISMEKLMEVMRKVLY